MDRIWPWAWDRYASRYSWAALAVAFPFSLPIYLFWSLLIVAVEKSGHYVLAAAVTVVAALVLHCVGALTGIRWFRRAQQWAAGHEVDRATALEATYTFTRRAVTRALWNDAVWFARLILPRNLRPRRHRVPRPSKREPRNCRDACNRTVGT